MAAALSGKIEPLSPAECVLGDLQATEVVPRGHVDLIRSTDRRLSELLYRHGETLLREDDVRRGLGEYVLGRLGERISTETVRTYLERSGLGLRDWKFDKTIRDLVAQCNNRYAKAIEIELINDDHIHRQLPQEIASNVHSNCNRGALIVAAGGFGKSCVLAQLLRLLQDRNIPTLCIRLDSIEQCRTASQLGEKIGLPASPAVVLAGIADNSPCVLIVDQLDAMSIVSGRNAALWDAFDELREEAGAYPAMKMVLACRDFDLEHDARLRKLTGDQSGFSTHRLDLLTDAELQGALDSASISSVNLNAIQRDILRVPLHLLLFLEGTPARGFSSVGQLYDRFWRKKESNVATRLGRSTFWTDVIEHLANAMSANQVLYASRSVVDKWSQDVDAMRSEHVLVDGAGDCQLRFFHESFFDYAFARRFCAKGRSVVELLTSSEQHLFRRAQVRQILTYRRDQEFGPYLTDICELLREPFIRFHIKRMVLAGLRQVDLPSEDEWKVVELYLRDRDLAAHAHLAVRDHVGWFDLLDRLGVLRNWLASDDEWYINFGCWMLHQTGLHDLRSSRVGKLLAPYSDAGPKWDKRLVQVMPWGKIHKSEEMGQLHLGLLARGAYDEYASGVQGSDFWHLYHEAASESPHFVIDAIATWFERAVRVYDDGKTTHFLNGAPHNRSQHGAMIVGEASALAPSYFLEKVFPLVRDVVLHSGVARNKSLARSRLWTCLSNRVDPFDVDDAILLHTRNALKWASINDPVAARSICRTISSAPHQIFAYLLLSAWAENPAAFADECVEYLTGDQARLDIGYTVISGNCAGLPQCAITRTALRAISPHCSQDALVRLEKAIVGYVDEYEKITPRQRGFKELLLLRSLDTTRVSTFTALRIEELQRKFPGLSDEIAADDHGGLLSAVASPIESSAAAHMSDDQWIGAMRKYDCTVDSLAGGPVELSRVLSDHARKDRSRFAGLVQRMPNEILPDYFSAILDGICSRFASLGGDDKEHDDRNRLATNVDVFLSVINRLHGLPNRPCGLSIVYGIESLSTRLLPNHVLEVVAYYAMHDPDPINDAWKETTADGRAVYSGSIEDFGINTVRGAAAWTMTSLLFDDLNRLPLLLPALRCLAKDPMIAVRSCALRAFLPILNTDRELAVSLFRQACDGCLEILGTHPFATFVHHASYSHYAQIAYLLRLGLSANDDNTVEIAARQVILAELSGVDIGDDGEVVRCGTDKMREAAAGIYAANLGDPTVGTVCVERLSQFFDDESADVRGQVSSAFRNLSGERLLDLEAVILRYIESAAFENGAEDLLYSLKKSTVELPTVVCRAAERIVGAIGVDGGNLEMKGAMSTHNLATLVVRQYEQARNDVVKKRCLDFIDEMERKGYYGITEELAKIAR